MRQASTRTDGGLILASGSCSAFTFHRKKAASDGLNTRASRGNESSAEGMAARGEAGRAAGGGGPGRRPGVGLQPHLGSCYRRSGCRRAVSCDRVSPSTSSVSLRPRPGGLHTLAASPLPAAVGGNTAPSERGDVVGLGVYSRHPQSSAQKPRIRPGAAGNNLITSGRRWSKMAANTLAPTQRNPGQCFHPFGGHDGKHMRMFSQKRAPLGGGWGAIQMMGML